MKTIKLTTWLTSLAVAGFLAGVGALIATLPAGEAWAATQGPRHGPPSPPGAMQFRMLLRDLDLNEQQRDTIREMLDGQREATMDVHQRLFEVRKSLHDAAIRGDDESILRGLADEVGKIEGEAALAQAKQLSGVIAILEPEQKSKLEELRAEAESRRDDRRQRFREER